MAASGSVDFDINVGVVIPASDGADQATVLHALNKFSGLTKSKNFGGSTSPTWVSAWADTVALVAGTATIDLTALARDVPLEDVDFDGLNIVAFAFAGAASNSNPIEVAPDATNGYNIFGTADDKVSVYPQMIVQVADMTSANLPAVAAGSADEITFTGTGTEAIHVLLIAGS